ncbi:syntaxin-11-like [Electrophorus electricus]|uniref:syntaxin-11-like n=1 Tax=Electrophorus electricus TaxID=8005 RepID=UPI0015D0CCA7|nr:syntaxin-11-like [Electrophorus electricus]XP_026854810.2 syntaxin-11-like [Electrophorus electricus]
MRDRLRHLQALSESSSYVEQLDNAEALPPSWNVHHEEPPQKHSTSTEMEAVLDETHDIRRDIQLILLDVKNLNEQNSRVRADLPNCTAIRQDSNAIVADIKTRAEDLLARLRRMDIRAKELEEMHGTDAAVSRIARVQYAGLSNSFRHAMVEYNEAEMSHREMCKTYIQRQMEIVGREVTGEQIEEMLENGQWNVFSENILSEGMTARSALSQIESRHKELLELERRIRSIHEVFLDVAMLVEEQDSMIDYIHTNVQKTDAEVKNVLMKLDRAKRHDRSNPFKKIFFRKR